MVRRLEFFSKRNLHNAVSQFVDANTGDLGSRKLHGDLKPLSRLLFEIKIARADQISFDQLQELQGYTAVIDRLTTDGNRTGLPPLTINTYRNSVVPLIDSALKEHSENKAYQLVKEFYSKNYKVIEDAIDLVRPLALYPNPKANLDNMIAFQTTLQALDPKFHLGSNAEAFSPSTALIIKELGNPNSPLTQDTLYDVKHDLEAMFEALGGDEFESIVDRMEHVPKNWDETHEALGRIIQSQVRRGGRQP